MANKKFVAKNGIAVGSGNVTTDVIDQDGNVTANTVTVSGTTLNATFYAGTANNASYLEGSNGSYYTGYADNKAANAYSNATSYAATIAGTAYSNATTFASSAAATAYTNAASYADTKAGTAYSNAISYADTVAGTAYTNATSYAATIAGTAYSNATTFASSAAATAYSNAVSAASSSAATAYSNATTFAANATNISSGTLAELRLPFRMDQNVRTNDTVSFGNMTVTGNLTVTGTTVTVNANNLTIQDNMIYLNSNSAVTNPDLGIAGNYNDGTYRHAGFFRDASDGVWKVFDQYLPEPDASPYIDTANASFRIADFQANVITAASINVVSGASITTITAGNTTINGFINVSTNTATFGTAVYVVANGNVGIGTASPTERLHVNGNILANQYNSANASYYVTPNSTSYLRGLYVTESATNSGYIQFGEKYIYGTDDVTGGSFEIKSDGNSFIKSGNVGIGTTNPETKLHVESNGNTAITVHSTTGSGQSPSIRLQRGTWGTDGFNDIRLYNTTGGFYVDNIDSAGAATNLLTATTTGLGIGTTSPRGKLDVSGNTYIGNTFYVNPTGEYVGIGTTDPRNYPGWLTVDGGIDIRRFGTDALWIHSDNNNTFIEDLRNKPVHIMINSVERFTFANTFNFGLNTTSPGASIHIRHPDPRIRLEDQNGGDNIDLFAEYGAGGTEFKIRNSTLSRTDLTINGSGNVGVGTTSPSGKLHLYDSGNSLLFIEGGAGYEAGIWFRENGVNKWEIYKRANPDDLNFYSSDLTASVMTLAAAGGVGIGTLSPSTALHVAGSYSTPQTLISYSGAGNNGIFFHAQGAGTHTNWLIGQQRTISGFEITPSTTVGGTTFSTPAFVIDTSSNVGIGTTSPGTKLHILDSSGPVFRMVRTSNRFDIEADNNAMGFVSRDSGTASAYFSGFSGLTIGATTSTAGAKFAVRGTTDLGDSHDSTTSSLHTTRLSGYALRYDASNRYGNYGVLIFSASHGWTSSAKRFMITNGINANKFCIIRSVDGLTDPTLGDAGSITSGTADFTIDSSGNVGVGTTSPFSKLQVGSHTFSGGNGVYADSRAGITLHGSLTSIMYASTYNDSTYPDYGLVFVHGPNTSNYNVWSLSPDGPAKGNSLNFIYGSNASNIHTGTPKVVFRGDGNVGIGTTSPGSKLSVTGTNSSSVPLLDLVASGTGTFQRGVRLINSGMNSGDHIMYAVGRSDNSYNMGQFYFYYSGAGSTSNRISIGLHSVDDVLNILGTGNVGIGTTSPSARLHTSTNTSSDDVAAIIEGTGAFGSGLHLKASGTNGRTWRLISTGTSNTPGAGTLGFYDSSSGLYRFVIGTNGNVGIGISSPSQKLDVSGGIKLTDYVYLNDNYGLNWGGSTLITGVGGGVLKFYAGDASTIRMQVGSNVGIGTTNPSTKLDVNGTITCTSLTETSSMTFKENIDPITNALNAITKLVGVTYDRKDGTAKQRAGLIAEEVEQVLPNVVHKDENGNPTSIHYTNLIAYLVESIKELKAEIDVLKSK